MAEPTGVGAEKAQCPACHDQMEGVRCHGEVKHVGLHWADVSGDGDISEWGDNDELWDEVERLRAVIENAPHANACNLKRTAHWDDQKACDCWKADV